MKIPIALLALSLPLQAAPPSNDSFANAAVLSGEYMTVDGTTVEATRELNEPAGGGDNSVWYKWTSPAYGVAEFGALFAPTLGGDQRLEIFVGSGLNDLILVGSDDSRNEPQSAINVGAGVTYYIRYVMASSGSYATTFSSYVDLDSENFDQSLFKSTSYSNDNFSNAQLVTGKNVKVLGYPTAATREAGEPGETGSNTIWWKWVAPNSGKTIFSTAGSGVGTKNALTIATGSRVSDLTYTKINWDYEAEYAIDAKEGTTYYIALGEFYYFGLENLSYILSIDHTPDSGKTSGTGFKAKFLTLPRDLLDESLIKGEFTVKGITRHTVKIDDSRFYLLNSKISASGQKWQFNLGKKTFSVSPWTAKVVVTGYAGNKVVAKVTKEFRLW
jgi:hypothetical protein